MRAYTKGITKEQFVKETKAHQAADNFLKGTYGKGEKGCAVGCALKSVAKLKGIKLSYDDHSKYETHLGIPEWLAKLEDTIFEGVSLERSKYWPVEFAEAVNEGADLNQIKTPFIIYLMEENLKSIRSVKYDSDKFTEVKKAIELTEKVIIQMIEAQKLGDEKAINEAESAARSAESVASSAWSAESAASSAWSAAWSAASAASSAWSAARPAESAAWSAESAASSAASAAWFAESAARSAESAASSAASAASAAWSAAFERHADKLLELLKECK